MTELSDDLLVAYVDGQLARDQSEAIERVLDNDQVAARRVEALKDAHRRLATAFDAILAGELSELEETEPPPEAPAPEPAPVEEREPPALADPVPPTAALPPLGTPVLLGAAAGLVLIGGVAGYALRGDSAPAGPPPVAEASTGIGWQEDVARAHALFARESLEVGFESQGNLDLVRFQLAKAIGASLVIPDLSGEGLTFKRAQILRHGGAPVAQISYLGETGAPVALYAKAGAAPATTPKPGPSDGVRTAAFASGGILYLLAGRVPQETFEKLLRAARRQIVGG